MAKSKRTQLNIRVPEEMLQALKEHDDYVPYVQGRPTGVSNLAKEILMKHLGLKENKDGSIEKVS